MLPGIAGKGFGEGGEGFGGRGDDVPALGRLWRGEAFVDGAAEQFDERVVVASRVEDYDRPVEEAELLPCHHFREFFEGANSAGKGNDGACE